MPKKFLPQSPKYSLSRGPRLRLNLTFSMFSVIGVDMTPIPDPCCLLMNLFIQFNWFNCVIYSKFLFYNLQWIQACDYDYEYVQRFSSGMREIRRVCPQAHISQPPIIQYVTRGPGASCRGPGDSSVRRKIKTSNFFVFWLLLLLLWPAITHSPLRLSRILNKRH